MSQKMLLSRALRYKKQIIEKIQQCEADVIGYNSKPTDTIREIDVKQRFLERNILIDYLTNFKLIVQQATRPIQRQILQLSEAKSYLSFLNKINTTRGNIQGYDKVIEYQAVYCKADIDNTKEKAKVLIDNLQTEIDTHNTSIFIEVDDLPTV